MPHTARRTSPVTPEPREHAAQQAESAAHDLEVAAAHLRTAASHIRDGLIPRYAAHLLAARGHLIGVNHVLDDLAVAHAGRSFPQAD